MCFSDDYNLVGNTPGMNGATTPWGEIEIIHEMYIDEFKPWDYGHRAPIILDVMLSGGAVLGNIANGSTNFHTIQF